MWSKTGASLDSHQDFSLMLRNIFLLLALAWNRFSLQNWMIVFKFHMNFDTSFVLEILSWILETTAFGLPKKWFLAPLYFGTPKFHQVVLWEAQCRGVNFSSEASEAWVQIPALPIFFWPYDFKKVLSVLIPFICKIGSQLSLWIWEARTHGKVIIHDSRSRHRKVK